MRLSPDIKELDRLYKDYNRRSFIHPDPLEFLYNYDDIRDREIVGLISSHLAYGRVKQILKSVSSVLVKMNSSPHEFIMNSTNRQIRNKFSNFRHRFTSDEDLYKLLVATKEVIEKYGSLAECFIVGFSKEDETIIPALTEFTSKLNGNNGHCILPSPEKGSACKRLNLFLRWMIRKDDVDPGGWKGIPKSKLVVPLDTHMHKIGLKLGLTMRKQANLRTALEITSAFAKISPNDPVKYDFALTRFGIRDELSIN